MLYKEIKIGDKTYKCVLSASASIQAEKKLGENPLNVFMEMGDSKLPSIETIITILWASFQKYQHGISWDDACNIFDDYIADGHQLADIIPELLDIFEVSGYFKKPEAEEDDSKNAKTASLEL